VDEDKASASTAARLLRVAADNLEVVSELMVLVWRAWKGA
jgi:hypothetical protein